MRAALAFAIVLAAVSACGGTSLKAAGEKCVASSECDQGLLCDLAQPTPVCAGSGATQPTVDAAVDAHPLIDSSVDGSVHVDAAAPDAPGSDAAGSDAAIDAM